MQVGSSRSVLIRAAAAGAKNARRFVARTTQHTKRRAAAATGAIAAHHAANSTASSTTNSSSASLDASPASSAMSTASLDDGADGAGGGGRLKVLCLHGFLQTGLSFRSRVGSLRKALKSRAAFEFVDAPFLASSALAPEQMAELGGSPAGRTWFKWRDAAPGQRPSQSTEYLDFDRTFDHMAAALREHKPDGVFGFSQGATAAALLLARLAHDARAAEAEGRALDVPLPRFAVLCAGFLPRDPKFAALLESSRVAVPSLFIVGDADALIPPERSLALAATFDQASVTLLRHPGAHMVPTCSGDVKAAWVEFLGRFVPAGGGAGAGEDVEGAAAAAGDDGTDSDSQQAVAAGQR